MTAFTHQDVTELATARTRIKELEQFVLDRAIIHARLEGNRPGPVKTPYNLLQVTEKDLFNPDQENIRIMELDNTLYNARWETIYTVPREFVFGEPGEQERKWETYLALKAELEPTPEQQRAAKTTQPATTPRQKKPGIIRKREDVTGCYWECYGIYCDETTENNAMFCKTHANQKCRMCGKPADHGCPAELQFVCGEPLCPDHKAGRH